VGGIDTEALLIISAEIEAREKSRGKVNDMFNGLGRCPASFFGRPDGLFTLVVDESDIVI
jgi:hypothetical protein